MTKEQLSKLLHDTGCPVNRRGTSLKNEKTFPRIDYWEIAWEDVMASGSDYSEKVTWQISFSKIPRHPALINLRETLRAMGLHPMLFTNLIQRTGSGTLIFHLRRMERKYEPVN